MENSEIEAQQPGSENIVCASECSEDLTDGCGISDSAGVLEPSDVKIEEIKEQNSDEVLIKAEKTGLSRNDVTRESVENDVKEVNENGVRVEIECAEKDVKEVNENGARDVLIRCYFCDDFSFDVKDTESYKTHLREVHSVKKNLDVLVELTIKTQHGGKIIRYRM